VNDQEEALHVACLIAATELPTKPTDVGACQIVPLTQPQDTPPRQGYVTLVAAAPNASSVVVVEPEIRFRALHAITTVVPGSLDEYAARDLARTRFDRVLGLIAIAQGPDQSAPLLQIVSVTRLPRGTKPGDQITIQPAPITQSTIGGGVIDPMSAATLSRLFALDAMATSDPHVATLIRMWGAAERADRVRFSDPDRDACQVHYCKVVEQVAIAIQPGATEPTAADLEAIVSALATELGIGKSPAVQIAAIDAAAGQLRKARDEGHLRQLKKALDILNVESDLRRALIEVWELRSSRAGHPSPTSVTDDQVTKARWAAAELVARYFNWRWSGAAKTHSG
jgi:hypothetical protein